MYPHRWSLLAALLLVAPVLAQRSFLVTELEDSNDFDVLDEQEELDEQGRIGSFTVRSYSSAQLNSSKPFRLDENVECGRRPLFEGKNKKRIWRGYEARKGEFPSYVSLQIRAGFNSKGQPIYVFCGGVILSERHVLTAQHCIDLGDGILVHTGIAGESNFGSDPNSQRINSIRGCTTEHYKPDDETPGYNGARDYGILVLEEPIKFNDEAQPACMSREQLLMKDKVTAVGIGMTSAEPKTLSDRLWALPAESDGICLPSNDLMCFTAYAREMLGNVCLGDSGGPVYEMKNNRQHVTGIIVAADLRCNALNHFKTVNVVSEGPHIRKLMKTCLDEAMKDQRGGKKKRKRARRPLDLVQ